LLTGGEEGLDENTDGVAQAATTHRRELYRQNKMISYQ
jgi:hypothetical protein